MITVEELNGIGEGRLPGLLGVQIIDVAAGRISGRLEVQPHHLAPNGYLHAATVIALADTLCGYGCVASLPDGGTGFTTIELKSNFVGTKLDGIISGVATLTHGGRTSQVWDAIVTDEAAGRQLALFRCTQLILRG
jgi:1,4-dihydroxy-2-naphthoyl-CoA hydrolase